MSIPRTSIFRIPMCSLLVLIIAGCATAGSPEDADDNLVEIPAGALDEAYQAPGFDIQDYRALVVDECSVRFRENWQRDQNRERGPSDQVTAADMQRIEEQLAASCREIFTAELEKIELGEGEGVEGAESLTIRPAILDLDIADPDILSSARRTSVTTNAVRMKLRLEIFDPATNKILVRMIDSRRAESTARPRPTSSVGNMAEAERILRHSAALMGERLVASLD
jgi:hypothetical protein